MSIHFILHSIFCALSFARYLCVEVHHKKFEDLLTFYSRKRVPHLLFTFHPLIPSRSCTRGKKCQMNIKLQFFSSNFNLLNLNLCHYLLPILLKIGGDGLFFNSKFLGSNTNNILLACVGYNDSPNVDNLQPLHESEGLRNLDFVVVDEETFCCNALGRLVETKSNMEATLLQFTYLGFS